MSTGTSATFLCILNSVNSSLILFVINSYSIDLSDPFNGENNIAVLRIDPSFTFPQNTIEAAQINTRILQNGLVCQLAAWGRVNAQIATSRVRQIVVTQPILDRNECAAAITPHANRIAETMMCATSTTGLILKLKNEF